MIGSWRQQRWLSLKKTGLKKGDTSPEAMELEAAIKSLGPVRFNDKKKSK